MCAQGQRDVGRHETGDVTDVHRDGQAHRTSVLERI